MSENLGIFGTTTLALALLLSGCSSTSNEASSSTAFDTCQTASEEDLKNINEGMKSSKFQVESGFVADFNADDVAEIKMVFPTYKSPRIFAANIPVADGKPVVGLWGIQDFDYGWRITALDEQTKKYSNLGADISDSSATGRVNAVMLELSANTNVLSCLKK